MDAYENPGHKVVFTTTLNAIRDNRPCAAGWRKMLAYLGKTEADDEPINLLTILESNGVQDMLWALRCVDHPDLERVARLIACDFASAALCIYDKYPDDPRPRNAVEVARRYANGEATSRELSYARDAAWAAASAAARDARDAAWDARAAAWDAVGASQEKVIRKYLKSK